MRRTGWSVNCWSPGGSAVTLGVLLTLGCGDEPSHFTRHTSQETRHRAIAQGTEAADDSSVFFVELKGNGQRSICSASLITGDLLLTAAHCVTGQTGPVDCDSTGIETPLPPEEFRVSNVVNLQGAPDATWRFEYMTRPQTLSSAAPTGVLNDMYWPPCSPRGRSGSAP